MPRQRCSRIHGCQRNDSGTQELHGKEEQRNRGFNWVHDHNSNFKISKVTIMHCQLRAKKPSSHLNPVLCLRGRAIKEVDIYKYLEVYIDTQLRCMIEENRVIAKAMLDILMFCRLTHTRLGIKPRLIWLLFVFLTIPKMTYALDMWYVPLHKKEGMQNNSRSVRVLKAMGNIQTIDT